MISNLLKMTLRTAVVVCAFSSVALADVCVHNLQELRNRKDEMPLSIRTMPVSTEAAHFSDSVKFVTSDNQSKHAAFEFWWQGDETKGHFRSYGYTKIAFKKIVMNMWAVKLCYNAQASNLTMTLGDGAVYNFNAPLNGNSITAKGITVSKSDNTGFNKRLRSLGF